MFIFDAEKKEIDRVKERIAIERIQLRAEAVKLGPAARKGAMIGSVALSIKKLKPILRPVMIGLVQRSIAKHGKRGVLGAVGLIVASYATWRVFRARGDSEHGDTLED